MILLSCIALVSLACFLVLVTTPGFRQTPEARMAAGGLFFSFAASATYIAMRLIL